MGLSGLDTVGVGGSIPLAPTNENERLRPLLWPLFLPIFHQNRAPSSNRRQNFLTTSSVSWWSQVGGPPPTCGRTGSSWGNPGSRCKNKGSVGAGPFDDRLTTGGMNHILSPHLSIQPSNCLLNFLRINLNAQASVFMRRFLDSCVSAPGESREGGEPEGVQGGCPRLRHPAGAWPCRDEHRE